VVRHSPEAAAPIYGCLADLKAAGRIRRLSRERDVRVAFSVAGFPRRGTRRNGAPPPADKPSDLRI
jgi:hypothetical protein